MTEYIEREAFLEHMKKTNRYFDVKFDIEGFPAADVAPVVHGRFSETDRLVRDGKSKVYGWECTVCKRFTRSPFVDSWNFCPNCGARIDGGDNDDKSRDT